MIHEQITSWGMRNGSYACGTRGARSDALACREGDPYHFVILDYHMPEMDGGALARAIRAERALTGSVVMLTSAGALGETRQQIDDVVHARLA